MPEIKFDTGLVTYDLNGKCQVTFNPTDSAFVERLYNTFDELDKKQDAYKAEIERVGENKEIFEIAKKRDAEMRKMIDGVFEAPVCDALFAGMNVYSKASGAPVWFNLMMAVVELIEGNIERENQQENLRLSKYAAKYKRK